MVFVTNWTARVAGATIKEVKCEACGQIYKFRMERTATGSARNLYGLYGKATARRSFLRADDNLAQILESEVDPVPCPHCGRYQSNMFFQLGRMFGSKFKPNEFAEERARVPEDKAWLAARFADTMEAYNTFLQVWPTSKDRLSAKVRISELQGREEETKWTPAAKRRATILRILSAAAVAVAIGLFSFFFGRRY